MCSSLPPISASTSRNLRNLEKQLGVKVDLPPHQHHHHESQGMAGMPKKKSLLLNGSQTVYDQRPAGTRYTGKPVTVMEQRDRRR
jgi:hypothetical protein